MLQLTPINDNTLKVEVTGKLEEGDIRQLAAQAQQFIGNRDHLKVVVDATHFDGWADMEAAKKHFAFVREHNRQIDRVAIVAGHAWQHWVAGIMSVFVHPDVKLFEQGREAEAENWVKQAA